MNSSASSYGESVRTSRQVTMSHPSRMQDRPSNKLHKARRSAQIINGVWNEAGAQSGRKIPSIENLVNAAASASASKPAPRKGRFSARRVFRCITNAGRRSLCLSPKSGKNKVTISSPYNFEHVQGKTPHESLVGLPADEASRARSSDVSLALTSHPPVSQELSTCDRDHHIPIITLHQPTDPPVRCPVPTPSEIFLTVPHTQKHPAEPSRRVTLPASWTLSDQNTAGEESRRSEAIHQLLQTIERLQEEKLHLAQAAQTANINSSSLQAYTDNELFHLRAALESSQQDSANLRQQLVQQQVTQARLSQVQSRSPSPSRTESQLQRTQDELERLRYRIEEQGQHHRQELETLRLENDFLQRAHAMERDQLRGLVDSQRETISQLQAAVDTPRPSPVELPAPAVFELEARSPRIVRELPVHFGNSTPSFELATNEVVSPLSASSLSLPFIPASSSIYGDIFGIREIQSTRHVRSSSPVLPVGIEEDDEDLGEATSGFWHSR